MDLERTRSTDIQDSTISVTDTATEVLSGEEKNLEGWMIYNSGETNVFIRFGNDASTSEYAFVIAPGQLYETPANETFVGQVSAIVSEEDGTGSLRLTKKMR